MSAVNNLVRHVRGNPVHAVMEMRQLELKLVYVPSEMGNCEEESWHKVILDCTYLCMYFQLSDQCCHVMMRCFGMTWISAD